MESNDQKPTCDGPIDRSQSLNLDDAAKSIFDDASELPKDEREAFLEARCGNDVDVRRTVESLLKAHDEAGAFFTNATSAPPPEDSDAAGQRVGRYKLLQRIGEGGFGTVYMAEQEAPVRRRVALKIIKLGMDTKAVIARFEAERQALAMMDHPSIAKVFEAGATDTGRPYFVMELVKGVPITTYCNENKLSTEERLGLFTSVCGAVQHAHQKGIIHRDIKPSNVLVTVYDDKAVPVVIDFGIAKATQSRLTERTLFTEFKQMIGTPAYMSPEQAQMSALDVDTRSDIYSLGVLLYELLTGTTPFDANELRSLAYAEMQRVIREVEPPKPSTRLSTLNENALTTLAGQRRSEAKQLSRMLKGDLDWIVMKCLEKDRSRRYETAIGLARDIQRHIDHQPVVASPPSPAYRLKKFVRRHRMTVGATLSLILMLLSSTAIFWVLRNQAADAATGERKARQAAVVAQKETLRQLTDMYTSKGLADGASPLNGLASLWFAKAATIGIDDPSRVQLNMIRVNNWLRGQWEPAAAVEHPGSICDLLSFDPDDSRFLVSRITDNTSDGLCRIWDLNLEQAMTLPNAFRKTTAAAWATKGQILLGTREGHVALVSFPKFDVVQQWEVGASVASVANSADGRLVAAGCGKQIVVLSVHAGTRDVIECPAEVTYIAFGSKSEKLVAAFAGQKADVFALSGGDAIKARAAFPAVAHIHSPYRFVPPLLVDDDRVFVTIDQTSVATSSAALRWRDSSTGLEIASDQLHYDAENVFSLRATADGKSLVLAAPYHGRSFDVAARHAKADLHSGIALGTNCRGNVFAVGANDSVGNNTIEFYTLNSNGSASTAHPTIRVSGIVDAMTFSSDDRYVAAFIEGGHIRVWKVPSSSNSRGPGCVMKLDAGVESWAGFSPDGQYAAPVGHMFAEPCVRWIQVFEPATSSFVGARLELNGMLASAAFSPDGKWIATATGRSSDPRVLKIWDWRSGAEVCAGFPLPAEPLWVAFAPDKKAVAVHCNDGHVCIVNAGAGQLIAEFTVSREGETHPYASGRGSICYSRDGKSLYTLGSKTVEAWNPSNGKQFFTLGHGSECWAMAESPDGKTLATAARDCTLRLWDASNGQSLSPAIQLPSVPVDLAFSPDGTKLLVGGGALKIFDVRTSKLDRELPGAASGRYTPDSRWIVTAGSSMTIWDPTSGYALCRGLQPSGQHQLLDISSDGKWAVAAGAKDVTFLDLSKAITADARTPEAALSWSELISGARIQDTEIVGMPSAEWLSRWREFRLSHPEPLIDPPIVQPSL